MAISLLQTYRVASYIAGRKLRGVKRYPLVLMLEPLFMCNLACSGCGKIDYPKDILQKRVSVEDALRGVAGVRFADVNLATERARGETGLSRGAWPRALRLAHARP